MKKGNKLKLGKKEGEISLKSQVESTLVMSIRELIDETIKPTTYHIANLASFIQASVLFEDIYLLGRSGRKVSPLTILPNQLKGNSFYKYQIITDAKERRSLAENKIQESLLNKTSLLDKEGWGSIYSGLRNLLQSNGRGWIRVLERDITTLLSDKTKYADEGIELALESLNYEIYGHLLNKEKLSIYYWIKTFYNIQIALDNERVFFGNFTRTPFVGPVYDILSREFISNLRLKGLIPDGIGNTVMSLKDKNEGAAWDAVLPTLVSKVLEIAHYDRKRIADAILELRSSKDAKRFRSHYKVLLETKKTDNLYDLMTNDITELTSRWRELSQSGYKKVTWIAPFLKFYMGGKWLFSEYHNLVYFLHHFYHLRIFWDKNANEINIDQDAKQAVYKTFGDIEEI